MARALLRALTCCGAAPSLPRFAPAWRCRTTDLRRGCSPWRCRRSRWRQSCSPVTSTSRRWRRCWRPDWALEAHSLWRRMAVPWLRWLLGRDGASDFALGVSGEDQTSHRAEVEALVALLEALVLTCSSGSVHVLVDCQAALRVVQGGGCAPLLARRAVELQARLRGRVRLTFWWVPSHGKVAPAQWMVPPCGEAVARALNARADRVARSCATRRAAGSGRQQCADQRAQAMTWEKQALQTLTAVAHRWAEA